MSVKEQLEAHREEVLSLAAEHGASRVRVFGSVARGEAGATSDIDLLVELHPDRSLLDHVALILDLEALLGRPVDVVNDRALHPELHDRIMREAVPL